MRRLKAEREARKLTRPRKRGDPEHDFAHLVEALAIRGEMIRAGAAERVDLANRVAKLEQENAELRAALEKDAA